MKLTIVVLFFLIFNSSFPQRARLYSGQPSKTYYKNGSLRVDRNFKEGKLLGYKTYYKSGALRSNYVFNKKGYHDSIANFYFPNGKVKTIWQYKNDIVKKRTDYDVEGNEIKNKKKYDRIFTCNKELKGDKYSVKWTYRRALSNLHLGFYDESLEDLLFVTSEINPNSSRVRLSAERNVYHAMAIIYSATEDYEKGLKNNFKALAIDSDNQSILNNLGELLLQAKDYDLALKYLDKCHEINPKNYHAYFNKAKVYLDTGDYAKALSFIERTIADERSHKLSKKNIDDERTIWATRGEIYCKLGRLEEAEKDIKKALEENPVNSYAYKSLSAIYIEKNQPEMVCDALAKAEQYKYDKAYETTEVANMINQYCGVK